MCADDVVCCGAEPLSSSTTSRSGGVVPEWVAELVGSIAAGCREAGCALVGGETAEHPGLMDDDAFDLSGCCIGVVERGDCIDGTAVACRRRRSSGLASSGLHANGFSLVRALLAQCDIDLTSRTRSASAVARRRRADVVVAAEPDEALATLGDVLLTPTRIYARAILAAARAPGAWARPARHRAHHRRRPAREPAAGAAGRAGARGSTRGAGRCRR